VFLGLYGIFALVTSTRGRERCAALALVVAPPVLWMGLDWLGSGDVLRSGEIARTSPLGSAAKAEQPALAVFGRLADTVIAPSSCSPWSPWRSRCAAAGATCWRSRRSCCCGPRSSP